MAASARVEEGSSKLNSYRAYTGILRGEIFPGRFSGWELVRSESLELRLARSHAQGLVSFLLWNWLVFCLVGQGQVWLWFHGQSVFLSKTPY